ncbi:MAG: type IV secretory system conjugative DNA transfer family protein [Hydrococcus sp. RM1_1_31]|nr:type IV secretory system conjugative DNA transfer family protein [Hydrococcus sp. RM1_1_31]
MQKDSLALFAGNAPMIGWKPHLKTFLTGNPSVLPLPNLNQHTVVLGSTGCGKTTTINNRLLQDAIRQGHPMVVFDPKGDLAQIHAPYADAFGYEIYCLAPGKPYTDRFNILDFLRTFKDSGRAEQAAKTINRNANVGVSKTDPFFGPSGDKLVRSILMLAKASPYPDLLMAKRLLSLPDLTERLRVAFESGRLILELRTAFNSFYRARKAIKLLLALPLPRVWSLTALPKMNSSMLLLAKVPFPWILPDEKFCSSSHRSTKKMLSCRSWQHSSIYLLKLILVAKEKILYYCFWKNFRSVIFLESSVGWHLDVLVV